MVLVKIYRKYRVKLSKNKQKPIDNKLGVGCGEIRTLEHIRW